jgi:hypothetical protein
MNLFIISLFFSSRLLKDGKSNLLLPITEESDKYYAKLSEDYNFWRHLAREFYTKEEIKTEDSNIAKKEREAVQTNLSAKRLNTRRNFIIKYKSISHSNNNKFKIKIL